MSINEATARQIQAATPGNSTWLSANAGSGKTRVLTDRVARLLLSGVLPQNILCLTYTKAAASEMQNRLFARLGEWAMREDALLRESLRELGVTGTLDLPAARRLFARAIEAPGGLKIQTIHAYCASILRRFPMEAGVSVQFREMDDRMARGLRASVLEQMCKGDDLASVTPLLRVLGGGELDALCIDIIQNKDLFQTPMTLPEFQERLSLPVGTTHENIISRCFDADDFLMLEQLRDAMKTGSITDQKHADRLSQVSLKQPNLRLLHCLESFVLLQKHPFSAKIDKIPTKALREGSCAGFMAQFNALISRVELAKQQRISQDLAERSHALHGFSYKFLARYEAEKNRRGVLDFDDQISKAAALLTNPSIAAWVLYRLDGGIDHILVDEAQDTSPLQWQIIDSLAREFTSGASAREGAERTIFVVGDPKQSIYSFQGAKPQEFARMRQSFDERLRQIERRLSILPLEFSFRSSKAILNFVDQALGEVPGLAETVHHRAFFDELPGRVDLWPAVLPVKDEDDREWSDPVDRPAPTHHTVTLAREMAEHMEYLINNEVIQGSNGVRRAVGAGDILVLVQARSRLFDEIISACKARGLPIAGADRLKIGAELAVKDLTALLSFLATPEDDLSLASVLKSPILGWDEDQLFRLSHGRLRGQYLWRVVSDRADEHGETLRILHDLRDVSDFLRPYELIERVLNRHDARRRLLARLGQEAEDGIDAFLAQAMSYEQTEIPSLTGFLSWLEGDDVTIKRQMDMVGQQIRVMTIHGAKGLEAPIVYLPELVKRANTSSGPIIDLGDGVGYWRPPQESQNDVVIQSVERSKQAAREENDRLLYVAMTRAEQWLILCAAGKPREEDDWYSTCAQAMGKMEAAPCEFPTGTGSRVEYGAWAESDLIELKVESYQSLTELPDWVNMPAESVKKTEKPRSPSQLGGDKSVAGWSEREHSLDVLAYGDFVHLLLEKLPKIPSDQWEVAAAHYADETLHVSYVQSGLQEALTVLNAPEFGDIFAPTSLAEVSITATIPEISDKPMVGVIDRMVVNSDHVLIVDFKTNRKVPATEQEIPEGFLRQLGAYQRMAQAIYPGRRVKTAILWTISKQLMQVPSDMVEQALGRVDAAQTRS